MQRFYHNHVDYAFSSAHTILPDEVDELHAKPTLNDSSFELGIDLLYKYVNGNNDTVVYEGASFDVVNNAVGNQYDTNLTTLESHLQVLDQPNLCNIPSTPLDYCKEVGKVIAKK